MVGHTDNTGSLKYNIDLSQKRVTLIIVVIFLIGLVSTSINAAEAEFNFSMRERKSEL